MTKDTLNANENVNAEINGNKISEDLTTPKKSSEVSAAVSGTSRIAAAAAYSPYDVIKTFMAALDKSELGGEYAFDEAIEACSNGKFSTGEEVIAALLNDANSVDSDTFLKDFCGIILDNEDTGAITGYDVGYSNTAKTAESVIPETGTRDTTFTDQDFTVKGLKFTLGDWVYPDDSSTPIFVSKNFSDLSADEQFIWQSLYSYWAQNALDLLEESYGYSFEDTDATVTEIAVKFVHVSQGGTLADTGYYDDDGDGTIDHMFLQINTAYYNSFVDDDENGISPSGQVYLDRTVAHELTHAIMNAKINYRYDLPMIITEGMAEITHGIDDVRRTDITRMMSNTALLEAALNLGTTYHRVQGLGAPDYSGGYIFLRYLAWQSANTDDGGLTINNSTANTVVTGSRFADEITNSAARVTINSSGGDDTVSNSGAYALINSGDDNNFISNTAHHVTIQTGDGSNTIDNRGVNSSILSGAGNDSIFNAATNVTISAGAGDDTISTTMHSNVFVFGSGDGNDLILGANDQDTLKITADNYIANTVDGSVIVSVSGGSFVTLDAAVQIDGHFAGDVTVDGGPVSNEIVNATITGGANNDTIYNSAETVRIFANDGADYIQNSGSNVTIDAGNGADSVFSSGDNVSITGDSNYISADGDNLTISTSNATVGFGGGTNLQIDATGSNVVNVISAENATVNNASGIIRVQTSSNVQVNASGTVYADANSSNVSITTADNDDSINNWATGALVNVAGGNNTVENRATATNATIQSGSGDDSIVNSASSVSIDASDGANFVYNAAEASAVTISTGSGDDTINNLGSAQIDAASGNNFIANRNTASLSTVFSGDGSDTVQNWATSVSINLSAGDNVIYNDAAANAATIQTTDGNDSIANFASNALINSGAGNDTLVNGANSSATTITASGAATVNNQGAFANITLADADDSIYTAGISVTVIAANGNNTLNNLGANSSFSFGTGNDYLYNSKDASAIRASLGDGNNTIISYAANSTFSAGSNDDFIYNGASATTVSISTAAGNNTIQNYGSDVTISAGSGYDTIFNYADAADAIINAGTGNNYLRNMAGGVSIKSGSDADAIYNWGENVTIGSGSGGDTIFLQGGSAFIRYENASGTDYVLGVKAGDTIGVEGDYQDLTTNEGHAVISERAA